MKDGDKHVDPMAADLRTRVQFPPPPPNSDSKTMVGPKNWTVLCISSLIASKESPILVEWREMKILRQNPIYA